MSDEEEFEDIQYCCNMCGFSWCECCWKCGMSHRDCEGCECTECEDCSNK
jgi:hypothetical protein